MPRMIWKGSVSFGLVEIPVALVAAEQGDEVHFSHIDRRTFDPVGYKRINKNTGEEVPWEEIVRGFQYEPDEYVVLTDEDLKRANVKATQTVEILDFVDRKDIDPVYFDKPYYLEPLKKASKSYALLRETLTRTGRVGIAKVVIRTRQHLAALLVREGVLVLNLLRFAHEVRDPKELEVPEDSLSALGVSEKEVKMAERLVQGMATRWNPKKYKDEYQTDLLAMIDKKVKSGQTHVIERPGEEGDEEAPRADVVDLMPLLKKSLDKQGGGTDEEESGSVKTARARSPKRAAAKSAPASASKGASRKAAPPARKKVPRTARSA
jgi:DNA end-binding protein Ku